MNSKAEYPAVFARFYDVIYDHVRSSADHDYFLNKILNAGGPVLEVGVGTGRFFIEALNQGADIDGIDISPEMVKVLKQKLPPGEQHRVQIQDICKLKLDRKYNLIIAPFRVFMHLIEVKDQSSALNSVYDHLLPGGKFIFDLFVPNLKLLHEGLENFNDFSGEYEPGKKLQRFSTMHADLIRQISHVAFRFEWTEDSKEYTEEWKTDLRFFFRYELEHLLSKSPFSEYYIYGGLSEEPLMKDSKEFIVVCSR
jgi:SAM-dependent methyltransferase